MKFYFFYILLFFFFLTSPVFVFAADPSLTIITPVENAPVTAGTPLVVTWQSKDIPATTADVKTSILFKVSDANDNPKLSLKGILSTATTYTWDVPTNLAPGAYKVKVQIRVETKGRGLLYGAIRTIRVEGIPTVEFTNPPANVVLQPGNAYTFSFAWKNLYDQPDRKWAFASTLVTESKGDKDVTAADTLDSEFKVPFQSQLDQPHTDGKLNAAGQGAPISVNFTVPPSYSGQGFRKFAVTFLLYNEDGEKPTGVGVYKNSFTASRTFSLTNKKGDVNGDGAVCTGDLNLVANFIDRIADSEATVKQDSAYPFFLLNYDVAGGSGGKGDGVVDMKDLILIATNHRQGACPR